MPVKRISKKIFHPAQVERWQRNPANLHAPKVICWHSDGETIMSRDMEEQIAKASVAGMFAFIRDEESIQYYAKESTDDQSSTNTSSAT